MPACSCSSLISGHCFSPVAWYTHVATLDHQKVNLFINGVCCPSSSSVLSTTSSQIKTRKRRHSQRCLQPTRSPSYSSPSSSPPASPIHHPHHPDTSPSPSEHTSAVGFLTSQQECYQLGHFQPELSQPELSQLLPSHTATLTQHSTRSKNRTTRSASKVLATNHGQSHGTTTTPRSHQIGSVLILLRLSPL
jgi:hypothetical protein